jgi:hypothetical protein
LFALYASNTLSSSQGTYEPLDFSASDIIMSIGPHYLSKLPYFTGSDNLTKIYLKNANLSYDYSNISFTGDPIRHDNFVGVPAVIINATIRNDYGVEEIASFSQESLSYLGFAIDVYLYDETGTVVPTVRTGDPFIGCQEFALKSGEIKTFYLVLATDNRNIYSFEIYFSWPLDI